MAFEIRQNAFLAGALPIPWGPHDVLQTPSSADDGTPLPIPRTLLLLSSERATWRLRHLDLVWAFHPNICQEPSPVCDSCTLSLC